MGHRNLRVVIVEPHGTGGLIHYAYQMAGALSDAGASVTLVTSTDYELASLPHNFRVERRLRLWPHNDPGGREEHRSSHRARVAKGRRAARRVGRGVRLLWAWVELARSLPNREVDVGQFGHVMYPFEGLFLTVLRRRGLVLTSVCHEFEWRERPDGWAKRAAAFASRRAYRNFDAIFHHSESSRTQFCRVYPELAGRTFVIPHGGSQIFHLLAHDVEKHVRALRLRFGLSESERVVLCFGHLVPSKGVDDLVRAHAIVRSRMPIRLLVAGYPSKLFDVGGLERLIRDLGVEDSVDLDLRYIPGDEVAALMELAAVVVFPYRHASQSGALQVAYSFGRPVVATRVGGLPEAVDDGRSGLLVPPGSPGYLAEAIARIVSDPKLSAEMGANARRLTATRHDWTDIARTILDIYEDIAVIHRNPD